TFAANVEVGIVSGLERQDFEIEFFFDKKAERALGGSGTRGIGIEIHYNIFRVSRQKLGLQFGKSSPGAGDDVVESGGENRDAIHLAFHQDGVIKLADRFLRLIQIEKYARLRINRCLGRVQVFGTGLLVRGERASSEGDDAPAIVGNGEH